MLHTLHLQMAVFSWSHSYTWPTRNFWARLKKQHLKSEHCERKEWKLHRSDPVICLFSGPPTRQSKDASKMTLTHSTVHVRQQLMLTWLLLDVLQQQLTLLHTSCPSSCILFILTRYKHPCLTLQAMRRY